MSQKDALKKPEVKSLNDFLFKEISIEELERRLELAEAPKTCGQYTAPKSEA